MEEISSPEGLNFGVVDQPITIWTSPNTRSKDIATHFTSQTVEINALKDMNPGLVDNMTQEQIKAKYPQEFEEHQQDVYNYRFPRAEVPRLYSASIETQLKEE